MENEKSPPAFDVAKVEERFKNSNWSAVLGDKSWQLALEQQP